MVSKFGRLRLAALGVAVCLVSTAQAENVLIHWSPPQVNTDNSPANNLYVFCVWEGTSARDLTPVVFAPATESDMTLYNVSPGWHYFAMSTINKLGVESVRGPTVSYYVP